MWKCEYDSSNYEFYKKVCEVLQVEKPLKELKVNDEVYSEDKDQTSIYHRKWYEGDLSKFLETYRDFIKNEIYPKVKVFWHGERIVYQARPTVRFHYPGNLAVGEFHRDRDYSHNPHEVNIFLPITLAYNNSAMWIESEEGKEDYQPMNAGYGQFVLFSGANLKHGNKLNDTGFCRVSFDFRVSPLSKYEEWAKSERSSVTTGKKMVVGDYYAIID